MNSFLSFIIILLIPFSYDTFFGVRVLLLLPIIMAFLIFYNKGEKIIILQDFRLSLILIFILIGYLSTTKDFLFMIPVFLFFMFVYWFIFLGKEQIKKIDLKKLVRIYIMVALIFSITLFIQAIMYFNGYTFGKVEVFGGDRVAFYVIWTDSSFVSLYLASVIPLIFYLYKGKSAFILTLIFLLATVLSSARTGIVSLYIIITLYVFIIVIELIIEWKIKIKNIFFLSSYFLFMILVIYIFFNFGLGRLEEGDNGRFQSYIDSFNIFFKSILFGTMYSSTNTVGAHNFIIHILASGGILFFLPFCLWLYIILKKTFLVNIHIKNSLLVCFVGLNFIPSFFSAYFFSFLLSIMLINYQQLKMTNYRKEVYSD
jgi:hypothetical protein